MENKSSRWRSIFAVVFVLVLGALAMRATAGLSFATNTTSLAPNDHLAWTPNNSPNAHPGAESTNGITVVTTEPGGFRLDAQGFDGFPATQYVIDTQDGGAVTFTFSVPLLGFGVQVANAFGGTYVATMTNYSGTNLLAVFSVTNATAIPVFMGVLDTAPAITKVVIDSYPVSTGSRGYSLFSDLSLKGPPLLKVSAAAPNVTVFWPSPSTGFRLQENTNLASTNWSNFIGTTNDDGTNKSVLINPATGDVFFRLITP